VISRIPARTDREKAEEKLALPSAKLIALELRKKDVVNNGN
jgi:hypothetical protein